VVSLPVDRPPAVPLDLDIQLQGRKNTFFEKAKYEFLYVSNDERIVNDKKDRPIERTAQ